MTSGAMMFAKSPEIAREIIHKLRTKKVSKYYIAISARKPAKKQGSVIGDMARGRRGSWMLQRTTENPAITRFIAAAIPERPGKMAFLLKPETGKTHQLRVALKSLGAPVLGDIRYANAVDAGKEARGYLHCAAMRLYIGDTLHQVVCPPVEIERMAAAMSGNGENIDNVIMEDEFSSSGIQQLFEGWFPPGIEEDEGVWFSDNKLLRSLPETLLTYN
jgi:tRNA pseudouridine32 synthase / 23S rRNA pseudouridine746 synthase